ncbi:adh short domain containing protein, partial [Asbolus verrucosus]
LANNVDGHIIHINSVVGHVVPNFPGSNVHPASKHAVTALTETLRQELIHIQTKIKITSASPGAVDTETIETNEIKLSPEMEGSTKVEI